MADVDKMRCTNCKHLKTFESGMVYAQCACEKLKFALFESDTRKHWCERWEKRVTMMDDFFKKYPNAPKYEDGSPKVCAENIYGGECKIGTTCEKCWRQAVGTLDKEKPPEGGE